MGARKMRSKLIEVSHFIPCLRNSASFSMRNASLQKMYSVRCCTSVCVGACVFPSFVIHNLWVCTVASLEEMYSVGCFTTICVGGCMFPALVSQNLWVCIDIYNVYSSLAARMCSKKCAAQAASAVYVGGGCVFPAFIIQNLWVC